MQGSFLNTDALVNLGLRFLISRIGMIEKNNPQDKYPKATPWGHWFV